MEDICAVIVTYNPEMKLIYNVESLLNQVDQIIIIDNGSSFGSKGFIDVVKNMSRVKAHYFKSNKGLAAGLNYGVEIAKKSGYNWYLLLDHDSIASKNYIKNCCQTIEGLCYMLAMDAGKLKGFMVFRLVQFTKYMDYYLYSLGFKKQTKVQKESILKTLDIYLQDWEEIIK